MLGPFHGRTLCPLVAWTLRRGVSEPGSRPGWPAWGSGKLITKELVAAGDFDLVSVAEVGKLMGGDASGRVSR